MRISVNTGFVTNSSSVVHHFPRELLDHPKVKEFLETFEIENGFVGSDLWHRAECSSVAFTAENKAKIEAQKVYGSEYHTGTVPANTDTDEIVVIYGDEYNGLAMDFVDLLRGITNNESWGSQYN